MGDFHAQAVIQNVPDRQRQHPGDQAGPQGADLLQRAQPGQLRAGPEGHLAKAVASTAAQARPGPHGQLTRRDQVRRHVWRGRYGVGGPAGEDPDRLRQRAGVQVAISEIADREAAPVAGPQPPTRGAQVGGEPGDGGVAGLFVDVAKAPRWQVADPAGQAETGFQEQLLHLAIRSPQGVGDAPVAEKGDLLSRQIALAALGTGLPLRGQRQNRMHVKIIVHRGHPLGARSEQV